MVLGMHDSAVWRLRTLTSPNSLQVGNGTARVYLNIHEVRPCQGSAHLPVLAQNTRLLHLISQNLSWINLTWPVSLDLLYILAGPKIASAEAAFPRFSQEEGGNNRSCSKVSPVPPRGRHQTGKQENSLVVSPVSHPASDSGAGGNLQTVPPT